MKNVEISRRRFGQLMAGVAASAMLPFSLRALAAAGSGTAVAATFPGNWEDAYRTILTPILKKEGFDLTVSLRWPRTSWQKCWPAPETRLTTRC
ncbi:hypothetical protein ERHA55_26120 [Erwinia rhapontici]|nr:hypothetical protein [Erwinia rhapontici]BCQ45085.1 hypothetical protein ERHA55_26120 [Erwinia rhapontici]